MKLFRIAAVLALLFAASGTWAKDLCEGKKKGTVYFLIKKFPGTLFYLQKFPNGISQEKCGPYFV